MTWMKWNRSKYTSHVSYQFWAAFAHWQFTVDTVDLVPKTTYLCQTWLSLPKNPVKIKTLIPMHLLYFHFFVSSYFTNCIDILHLYFFLINLLHRQGKLETVTPAQWAGFFYALYRSLFRIWETIALIRIKQCFLKTVKNTEGVGVFIRIAFGTANVKCTVMVFIKKVKTLSMMSTGHSSCSISNTTKLNRSLTKLSTSQSQLQIPGLPYWRKGRKFFIKTHQDQTPVTFSPFSNLLLLLLEGQIN